MAGELVLGADQSVIDVLSEASITTPLSWDFQRQWVIPYSAAAGRLPVASVVEVTSNARVVVSDSKGLRWAEGAAVVVRV